MKVLIVGNAAREHAIADAFYRSPREPVVFAAMGYTNPGIVRITERTGGSYKIMKVTDPKSVADYAEKSKVDLAFVGPEEPLFHLVSDELWSREIPTIGAKRNLAMIEMSKVFMRRLQEKYKIPGRLRFHPFYSEDELAAYMKKYEDLIDASVALKPARQAGGKGVKVIPDQKIFLRKDMRKLEVQHSKEIIEKGLSGELEEKFFLEERGYGVEFTVQALTDGKNLLPMPVVHDHPHFNANFMGSECGGMGSIMGPTKGEITFDELGGASKYRSNWISQENYLTPFINAKEFDMTIEIMKKTLVALEKEVGEPYVGGISGQMMLTPYWGPTILEYYARLGDPEIMNVLPLVKTDIVDICDAILDRRLNRIKLDIENKASVVKCIAPRGYPNNRKDGEGHPLEVREDKIEKLGGKVFWASVYTENGKFYTGGSRAVEVFAAADYVEEGAAITEEATRYIRTTDGWGMFHRSDIGTPEALRVFKEETQKAKWRYQKLMSLGRLGEGRISWLPGKGRIEVFK
jgi:phosphoribosylamine--glycine ligase